MCTYRGYWAQGFPQQTQVPGLARGGGTDCYLFLSNIRRCLCCSGKKAPTVCDLTAISSTCARSPHAPTRVCDMTMLTSRTPPHTIPNAKRNICLKQEGTCYDLTSKQVESKFHNFNGYIWTMFWLMGLLAY